MELIAYARFAPHLAAAGRKCRLSNRHAGQISMPAVTASEVLIVFISINHAPPETQRGAPRPRPQLRADRGGAGANVSAQPTAYQPHGRCPSVLDAQLATIVQKD